VPADPLLSVHGLSKTYANRGQARVALAGVGFTLERARILGVVGASGSGKSTLARCLAGFEAPTSGEILFEGRPLAPERRLQIQLIFQQPAESLNPRFTAAEIVEEPLVIQRRGAPAERRERAAAALELVGIARAALGKRAHQFSGGERQRLAIARSLAVEPKLLILDESFNGLDPSLTAQISGLLRELQEALGLSYILISHDLELVAALATEIAVMEGGRLVEKGPAGILTTAPEHARTRELLAASLALGGWGGAA
jgi:ABC-type glutathione transport system ATPase component